MKILKMLETSPNERFIETAVEALRNGEVIVYPTDTLYAFGCDALNNSAIEKVCKLKNIKSEKTSLSIICESISEIAKYARIDNANFGLLKGNLPGPFTFVLPALSKLPKAFKGRKTVGARIPDNAIAQALVRALGNPIMTTSVGGADGMDEDSICEPELIADHYGNGVSVVIDAGRGGMEPSTVVDCTGDEPEILREGRGELTL